jgi:hypothetical protein
MKFDIFSRKKFKCNVCGDKFKTDTELGQHLRRAPQRDPSELNIVELGKQSTSSSQDAAEKARRSGMTKGTAGAADTGSEYEQGAAGSNK